MKNLLYSLLFLLTSFAANAQSTAYEVGHSIGYFIGRTLPLLIVFVAVFFIYRYVIVRRPSREKILPLGAKKPLRNIQHPCGYFVSWWQRRTHYSSKIIFTTLSYSSPSNSEALPLKIPISSNPRLLNRMKHSPSSAWLY